MPSNNPRGFAEALRNPVFRPMLELERTPDLSRGEQRLAAEVAITKLAGGDVPSFVHERAFDVLLVLANG